MMNTTFDSRFFAAILRTRRGEQSLRDVATETGVSIATLSRIENGETPDMEIFLVLSSWTRWPTSAFLNAGEARDTVQFVEQALRDDGVLASETIDAFLVLLRVVHDSSSQSRGKKQL